jgi:transcriptional regulator with XRE-family HTH domain
MIPETGPTPNKYTKYMGEMIRKAREDMGVSQEELAEKIYRKRLAVSEMENGKVEISAWTLPYLCAVLKKPLSYFYPPSMKEDIPEESLRPQEHEMVSYFREIRDEHLEKVAIDLVKVISDFDPVDMLWDFVDITIDQKERNKEIQDYIDSKKKKRLFQKP